MIAEMMAAEVAENIPTLAAIRPVLNSDQDAFPHCAYETTDMRNRRYLNRCTNVFDGSVRFYIAGLNYAQVSTITEQLKTLLIAYREVGATYHVRRCNLIDEGDIYEETTKDSRVFYVKSVTFDVMAVKL